MKIPVRLRWSDLKVMTMTPPLRLPGWIDHPPLTHGVVIAAFEAAIAALDPNALNRSSHAHNRLARQGRPSYPQPVRQARTKIRTSVAAPQTSTPDPFDHTLAGPTFGLAISEPEIMSQSI